MPDNDSSVQTPSVSGERKLAAIMFTDIVGFSRQMGSDEARMLRLLNVHNQLISQAVTVHHGHVIKTIGDAFLIDFPSVVYAVQCAQQIQSQFRIHNAVRDKAEQIHVRIGIHLGDVVQKDGDVFGDGVNIAARLQSLAEPDTIYISQVVHKEVEKKLDLGTVVSLGHPKLKHIAERFAVYALLPGSPKGLRQTLQVQRLKMFRRLRPAHWLSVAGLLLIAGTLVTIRSFPGLLPNIQPLVPSTQPLPLPDKPSIVVLPFTNMSDDPKQDYFSDGITEDITTGIAKIASLFVIARNSAFTYKGKAVRVQEVSKEMGVQYVLEGSVRRADNHVRITAQLIDGMTGAHLWAERFDRPLKDIFAVQDEIVQKIVTTLKLQLTLWEQGVLVRKTTDNLEAYDEVLRGLETGVIRERVTLEAITQARQRWEHAIELDSSYATAYALLSSTYYVGWLYALDPSREALEQAFSLSQKAITLDDSLPLAHRTLGMVYLMQKQHEQALAEAQRAVELNSNDPDNYVSLGLILSYVGRPEEAIVACRTAMRLNPHSPTSYANALGWNYLLLRRYDEGITVLKQAISRNPNYPPLRATLAIIYSEIGREDEARAEGAILLQQTPKFSLEVFAQRLPYKDPAALERHIAGLRKAGLK